MRTSFVAIASARGYWSMYCWNGLSEAQQERLIKVGNLPIGYKPEGECPNGAEMEVITMYDESPGPRFYCLDCGIGFLTVLANGAGSTGSSSTPST